MIKIILKYDGNGICSVFLNIDNDAMQLIVQDKTVKAVKKLNELESAIPFANVEIC